MMLSAFRTLRTVFAFSGRKLNTQVFSELSYNEIATPQLVKALIIKPIHNHSRVSQRALFHRKRVSSQIRTCFSEKKSKVFRRVNKLKRYFYSQILDRKIHATLSTKALRSIRKKGSFDNYILCTKPIDLDSKFGEYLRELMLRKLNDPNFRIPIMIGTNRKLRVKKYRRYLYLKDVRKTQIPKLFKETYRTFQKKFGQSPEEFSNEDYKKYLQLQNLKKTLGDQMDPTHPLLVEIREKMRVGFNAEEAKQFDEMAIQAEQDYVNHPKNQQYRRKRVEKAKKQIEILEMKLKEVSFVKEIQSPSK